MNNILSELNTKLDDNLSKQQEILKAIDFLPKGHINILNRNNKGYYYLTYREGKKIKNEYLGPVGKIDLTKTFVRLKERQIYDIQLKELKKEEKMLKKLINKGK